MIKIKEGFVDFDPDLSEQYIMSCVYMKSLRSLKFFYEKINGTTFETSFPYRARFLVSCSAKSPDWQKYFVPSSEFYIITNATIDIIKNKLISHGPLVLPIIAPGWSRFSNGLLGLWGKINRNSKDYYSLELPKLPFHYSNHWVLLVGWKDDINIRNGGYWICKNSWGADWGYDGFFNLGYNSLNSNSGRIGWMDYARGNYNWTSYNRLS